MTYKVFSLVVLVSFALSACKTNKDLMYLNNTVDMESVAGVDKAASVYLLKANDNLFVDIQSLSPLVNAMYNSTKGEGQQSGVAQNYGSLSAQFINGYQVSLLGDISLPLLGDLRVAGLSIEEARIVVQKRADEFIKDATVRLKLLSFKITVLGEVKAPGVFYNYNSTITVLEAISMARGITDYAQLKRVLVVRSTDGGSVTYRLDLTGKDFMSSEAFFLLPNDVLYVQPDKYKSIKINSTFYSLLLSSVSTLILILNLLK